MKNKNFWKEGYRKKTFAKLNSNTETDILIVGGGISGIFAAYELNKLGKRVVLIEAKGIGDGATGNSAGYLTLEPDITSFRELIKKIGEEETKKYWNNLKNAQSEVLEIIQKNNIKCDHFIADTFYVNTDNNFKKSSELGSALKNKNGFSSKILVEGKKTDEVNLEGIFNLEKVDNCLCLNPYRFINEFAKCISKKGVRIFENTKMISINKNICFTEGGEINFKKALVCIDSFGKQNINKFLTTIAITEKVNKKTLKDMRLDDKDATLWNTMDPSFFYTRITQDKRILIGYGDKKINTADYNISLDRSHFKMIQKFLKDRFGKFEKLKIDYAWSGIFGQSRKNIPEINQKGSVTYFAGGATQLVSIAFVKQIVIAYLSD